MSEQDDDLLMEQLRAALAQAADVKPEHRHAARGAFAWRTIDEELLALSHDSLLSSDALVRRAPDLAPPRTLAFEGTSLSLELEVVGDSLTGQVLPPQPCRIVVQTPDGDDQGVDVDASGFFTVAALPDGPLRLVVETAHGRMASHWWVG